MNKIYPFTIELWGTEAYSGEIEAESKKDAVKEIEDYMGIFVDEPEE